MAPRKNAGTPAKKKGKDAKPPAATKAANDAKLASDRDIERVRIEKDVPVPMSEEEFRRDSMKLAGAEVKLGKLKGDFRKVAEKFRADKREIEKEIAELSKSIDTKKIMKKQTVTEERIYTTMTLRWVADDGTIIDTQTMPPEMLQRDWIDSAPKGGERVEAEEEEDEEEDDGDDE